MRSRGPDSCRKPVAPLWPCSHANLVVMQGEIEAVETPRRLARLTSALRGALDLVGRVALPQLCASCREPVRGRRALRGLLVEALLHRAALLRAARHSICVRCPGPGSLSMEAIADPPAYDRARAAVRYDDIARTLVHALKYGDRLDLAPMMGRWMANAGREAARRGRRPGAGAAALAPAMGAALQPVGAARRGHRQRERRAGGARSAQARQGDAAAGRAVDRSERARTTCRAPSACRRTARPRSPAAG